MPVTESFEYQEVFEVIEPLKTIVCVLIGLFFIAIAIMWAYFEIQIEGPYSWASGLPYTWKKIVKWYSKPITGYHVSLGILGGLLLFVLVAVAVLAVGIEPLMAFFAYVGREKVLHILIKSFWILLSMLTLVVLYEDFLWNVLNPDPQFGVKDFKKKYPQVGEKSYVPCTPIPTFYVYLTSASLALSWLAGIVSEWMIIYAVMLAVTLVLAARRYRIDLKTKLNAKGI